MPQKLIQDPLAGLVAGFGSAFADIFFTESLCIPRVRVDGFWFFRGRPLGRFGFGSAGSFLGLPRFLGAGFGTGMESPRTSSSSNTPTMVCTQ